MVICVTLCVLHGLVFLPAFLILFDLFVKKLTKKSKIHLKNNENLSQIDNKQPSTATSSVIVAKNSIKKPIIDNKIESNNAIECNNNTNLSKIDESNQSITN